MIPRWPSEELLQQEVRELTELLRDADGCAELRAALAAKGLAASETVLAGLIEGEDESQYGVVITPAQKLIRFEIAPNGSLIRWELVDEREDLTSAFLAVSVGLDMVRNGQIA